MKRLLISVAIVAVVAGGCTANAICSKLQECDDKREDDDPGVCVAAENARINSLRANKEEECQKLADATLALESCLAQLDCDDFEEADHGHKCDPEQDDFDDANDDAVSGAEFQCSSFD